MRTAAVVCNIALFAFTCFVLLTEGISREAPYLILTLLLLLVPILTVIVLLRTRITLQGQRTPAKRSSTRTVASRVAVFCNLVLIVWCCWAIVSQYPHPKEEGAFAAASLMVFMVLTVLTPLISVVALLGGVRRKQQEEQRPVAHQQ